MLNNINKNGNVLRNQSVNFYRKCVENKLSTDEFQFKRDGTTQLKLEARGKSVSEHMWCYV